LWLVAGCHGRPLRPFDLDTPPQVTTAIGRAGVIDDRARFWELWCAIREDHGRQLADDRPCEDALVRFEGEGAPTGRPVSMRRATGALRIVVIPGLFGDCFKGTVAPFSDALAHLDTLGYRTETVWVSGSSSSAFNARHLRDAFLGMALEPGERLLVVGYSKGAIDMLEALVAYPEIVPRVAALVSVSGAINGSPLIEGLLRTYGDLARWLMQAPCPAGTGDGKGLDSLRPTRRMRFMATSTLPESVRYFSLVGVVDYDEASWPLRLRWRRLSDLDPRNDGQVLWTDAVIPGSHLLGYVRADHLTIALPFSRPGAPLRARLVNRNAFPREVMLEAVVRAVEESLPAPGRIGP
jgi:hypothetical protein